MKFSTKCAIIFLQILLLSVNFSFAQSINNYQERKTWLLKGLSNVKLRGRGKYGLPKACALLWNNPKDSLATNYITYALRDKNQSMFDFPGIALALGKFRKSFKPEQLAIIQADLEKLAKVDKNNGQGFMGHGTENHATMMWTSAYLFAQYFPDARWVNGMTSDDLKKEMKERLRKTFRNVYEKGYYEYLSTTYEVIMDYPVAILLEYSDDPEVKAIAEAFLLYKWSVLSLNNFDGGIVAPYARMISQEDYRPASKAVSPTLFQNWLFWGWGPNTHAISIKTFLDIPSTNHVIYSALSDIALPNVFNEIALGTYSPLETRSSAPTFGLYGSGISHMMLRKTYRSRNYAMGTGNFRWVPGGSYSDHDINGFNILWRSKNQFNYINCFHPYWNSSDNIKDRTPDTWNKGSVSPFMQTAQNKNTAIVLFNIPDKDPWANKSKAEVRAWRSAHVNQLIKRGMLRFPKTVDQVVEDKGWIFLKEGQTYIGIKPLKGYYIEKDRKGEGLDGFNIVKSDFGKTGFIFQIGSLQEHTSFANFRNSLLSSKISIEWEKFTVQYTNYNGDQLKIQYNSGLKADSDGLANSVPLAWLNGKSEISFEKWPIVQSKMINLEERILRIKSVKSSISVDWRSEYPLIKKSNP